MLLHSFEHDFMTALKILEVLDIEVPSKIGQAPIGIGAQVDEPETLTSIVLW